MFEFISARPPGQWPLRACRCSYCRAQGAVWTSDPAGQLRFHAEPAAAMIRYRFGQRSADFLLCPRCGSLVGAVAEIGGTNFGIINVWALATGRDSLPPARAVDYRDEDSCTRDLRRRRNWTPVFDHGTE